MHWNDSWHMGWMGLWWFLTLVAVMAIVWFAIAAFQRRGNGRGNGRESPEQALKRRYANGEIDRDTYERMLMDLRK